MEQVRGARGWGGAGEKGESKASGTGHPFCILCLGSQTLRVSGFEKVGGLKTKVETNGSTFANQNLHFPFFCFEKK